MHAIRMPWVAAILAVALLAASTAAVVSTSAATVGPIHELAVDVDLHTDKPALQRRNAKSVTPPSPRHLYGVRTWLTCTKKGRERG